MGCNLDKWEFWNKLKLKKRHFGFFSNWNHICDNDQMACWLYNCYYNEIFRCVIQFAMKKVFYQCCDWCFGAHCVFVCHINAQTQSQLCIAIEKANNLVECLCEGILSDGREGLTLLILFSVLNAVMPIVLFVLPPSGYCLWLVFKQ